ncbi:MAG: LamG-like jellyroll fold domain-containing protein, partial [Pseudomonadota bacterium]
YIDCGQVPRTDNVPQLSVGVWYKPNGSDTNNGIVARRDNSDGSDWSWYMRVTTSSVININAGLGGNFNGTTAITDTSHWYYLQWVFRSGSYTRLYVDGVQDFNHVIGVINLPTAPDGEHNFWIGAYYSSAFGMNGQFGPCYVHRRSLQLSEIRQLYRDPLAPFRQRRFTPTYSPVAEAATTTSVGWTRSLTPSPVRPSYKSGFARSASTSSSPGLWKGLVGAWVPALGNTGEKLYDVSGNKNHGTLTDMDPATDWISDPMGPVLDLDGSSDYIDIPSTVFDWSGTNNWSAFIWIKTTRASPYGYFMGTSIHHGWYIRNSGTNALYKIDDGSNFEYTTGTATITDGEWHLLGITLEGNGGPFLGWVDGQIDISLTSGSVGALADTFAIGTLGTKMMGQLGPTYLYNRAINPTEIRQLHRDPLAPFRLRRFTPTYSPVEEEAAATTSVGWTRSLTPSPVRPSYKSGFARSAAESSSPGLWKNLSGAWCPALGNTGFSELPDLSGLGQHAALDSMEGDNWEIHKGVTSLVTSATGGSTYGEYGNAPLNDSVGYPVTVSAWLRSDDGNKAAYSLNFNGSDALECTFVSSNNWRIGTRGGSSDQFLTGSIVVSDITTWQHVVVRWSSDTLRDLWVNGVQDLVSTVSVTAPPVIDKMLIGTARIHGSAYTAEANWGHLMFWRRSISDDEIRQLYRDPLAPFRQRRFTPTYPTAAAAATTTSVGWTRSLTPSPVRPSYKSGFARSRAESANPGLWNGMYSGGMGSQLYDIAARQPVSFYSNTADRIVGKYGEAWHFNDTRNAEAITLNHLGNTWLDGATEFTYGLAFRWHGTDSGDEDTLMGQWASVQGGTDNNAKRAIIRYDSTYNQMDWFLDDGNDEGMSIATSIEDDGWHVVLHRFKSGEQTGWIDGSLVATDSTPDTTIKSAVHSKVPEIAGGHLSTGTYNRDSARIDVAAWWIWDRAITPTEIRQVSNDPLAPFRLRRFTPTISGAAAAAVATRRIFLIS